MIIFPCKIIYLSLLITTGFKKTTVLRIVFEIFSLIDLFYFLFIVDFYPKAPFP